MTATNTASGLAPRTWGGSTVSVHLLTWDHAILSVEPPDSPPIFVPRSPEGLGDFLRRFERGEERVWLERVEASAPWSARRPAPRAHHTRRPTSVGIGHRYTVTEGGKPIDFRRIMHHLGFSGIRADPTDPNAYRFGWGGEVTADGTEAEVATPPIPLGADAIARVGELSAVGRACIESLLDDQHALDGTSTHLSVSVPKRGAPRRAVRYCRTFAPGLMLLLGRPSVGLLVRARPNRLELGGAFVDGERLAIATTYAVATTLALVARPRGFRDLEVATAVTPSDQRPGCHIARDAFGPDLHADGRRAVLQRRTKAVTAQQQMDETWARCRVWVIGLLDGDAIAAVDHAIEATTLLPRS